MEKNKGEKDKNSERNKEKILFILIIVFFILFSVSLFKEGVFNYDVGRYKQWGDMALNQGMSAFYLNEISQYTPLYHYVLKFESFVYIILFGSSAGLTSSYLLIFKSVPLLCNLVIGLLIFFYLLRDGRKKAILGMCLYLFNFAVVYNSGYWGQIDAANSLFMLTSVLFLLKKNYYLSLISVSMATLIKLQSAPLVILIGTFILFECDYKKIIKIVLVDLLVMLFLLLPYVLGGAFWQMIKMSFGMIDVDRIVTANAYNFWFLISPTSPNWQNTLSDKITFLGLSFKTIGFIMLISYVIFVCYKVYKDRSKENLIFAASMVAFAFFMLPTQIRERYLFPFFALFALIVLDNRRYLWIYITLMIAHLFNLMMVMSYSGRNIIFAAFQSIIDTLKNVVGFQTIAIAIALINVSVFVYLNKIWIFDKVDKK